MYDEEVRTTIALLKQKAEFIEEKLDSISTDLKVFKLAFDSEESLKKEDLDNHLVQDRWLFGILFVFLTAILVKVCFPTTGA